MILKEIIEKLNLTVICSSDQIENEVTGGYCSDLLSDVMGNARDGQIWMTIQVHKNIIAVAALKELCAIIIVKGLKPSDDTIEAAKTQNIALLSTYEPAFELAGKLYKLING
jgi:serine kinase of HPr protein (carbohydrate metabolism regulator)